MVVDNHQGEAHQDRCKGRPACKVRDVPVGRSGDSAESVCDDPGQDRSITAVA